jgi:hypothetical protein
MVLKNYGFAGSRYGLPPRQLSAVASILMEDKPTKIHLNGTGQADKEVWELALALGIDVVKTSVHDLVDLSDALLAAPVGKSIGTARVADYARGVGKEIIWVKEDGKVHRERDVRT